eukprot:COSAG03_NODE_637_length_6585_cov_2.441721_6_plen_203_part_00
MREGLLLLLSSATAVLGHPYMYTMGAGCRQPVAVSWDLACSHAWNGVARGWPSDSSSLPRAHHECCVAGWARHHGPHVCTRATAPTGHSREWFCRRTNRQVRPPQPRHCSLTLSLALVGLTGAPAAFCAPDFSRAKRSKSRSLDLRAPSRQARGSSMHRTARSSTSRLAPQAATGSAGRAGIVIMAARPNSRQPCACPAAVQ